MAKAATNHGPCTAGKTRFKDSKSQRLFERQVHYDRLCDPSIHSRLSGRSWPAIRPPPPTPPASLLPATVKHSHPGPCAVVCCLWTKPQLTNTDITGNLPEVVVAGLIGFNIRA